MLPFSMTDEQRVSANRVLLITAFLSLIVFSPLLTGGVYYIDDFHRLFSGNVSYWVNNGRPLAYALLIILHLSGVVSDLSPALLIIGLTILIGTLTWTSVRMTSMGMSPCVLILLVVLFNPFMSQASLYTYDSLGIYLSVALAYVATFNAAKSNRQYFFVGFSLLLASLCLYQTSVNYGFISLLTTLVLAASRDDEKELTKSFTGLAALLLALICYKLMIAPLTVIDPYNQARSQLVSLNLTGLYVVVENIREAFRVISLAFPGYNLIPVSIIFLVGATGCFKIAIRRLQHHELSIVNVGLFVVVLTSPLLVSLGIAGFLLLLNDTVFFPRILAAFSAAMIFNMLVAIRAFPSLKKPLIVLFVFNLLYSMVAMTATFRAIVNQNNFESGVMISIRDTLAALPEGQIKDLSFIGRGPLSSDVEPAMKNYPLLKEILYPSLMENNDFSFYGLSNRAAIQYPLIKASEEIKNFKPERVISSNCFYRMYIRSNTAIFNFSEASCNRSDKFK